MPFAPNETTPRKLGVAWVLRQAAVLAVLLLTAAHLAGVAYLARTERKVLSAAQASLAEAGLPAATLQTVRSRALGTLERGGCDARFARVAVCCNGRELDVVPAFRPDDDVRVTVSIPARACLSTTMGRLVPWLAEEDVIGEARFVVPE